MTDFLEIAKNYDKWSEYVDPSGIQTENEFNKMSLIDTIMFQLDCAGRDANSEVVQDMKTWLVDHFEYEPDGMQGALDQFTNAHTCEIDDNGDIWVADESGNGHWLDADKIAAFIVFCE